MSPNVISTFFLSVSRILRPDVWRSSIDFGFLETVRPLETDGLLETVRPLETVGLLETVPVFALYDDTPARPDALIN
jgi:hypothetical protein